MKFHFHKWFLTEPIDIWTRFRICTKCGKIQREFHPPGTNILHTEWKDFGLASGNMLHEIYEIQNKDKVPQKLPFFHHIHDLDDRY